MVVGLIGIEGVELKRFDRFSEFDSEIDPKPKQAGDRWRWPFDAFSGAHRIRASSA